MVSSAKRHSAPIRRSRNGCRECRRRHRRCDEVKPTCSYCSGVGIECNYSRELSWGGRPFRKSRFGQCMGRDFGAVKVPSDETIRTGRDSFNDQFVYMVQPSTQSVTNDCFPSGALSSKRSDNPGNSNDEESQAKPLQTPLDNRHSDQLPKVLETTSFDEFRETSHIPSHLGADSPTLQTLRPSSEVSFLPVRAQNLLDHFQHGVAMSISCHKGIQDDICSALIPMALSNNHLMAAMLCASACHRVSVGLPQNLDEVVHLRSVAVRLLNGALTHTPQFDPTVALATSVVLCLSETASSDADGGWRVYLSGASALRERLSGLSWQHGNAAHSVNRMYTSLRTIPTICGMGIGAKLDDGASIYDSDEYIDDFRGFSTSLVPIFEQIRILDEASQPQSVIYTSRGGTILEEPTAHSERRLQLIERVKSMLIFRTPRFRPEVLDSLSVATRTDFWLLDEAYHHMALLQLYRYGDRRNMPLNQSPKEAIERIIFCIGAMNIVAGPCPGVAALPPLFVAGCAATNDRDRSRIIGLLDQILACFGMGNVQSTKQFLQRWWNATGSEKISQEQKIGDLTFLPH